MKEIKSFREYITEQEQIKKNLILEDNESPVSTKLSVTNDKLALTARTPEARLEELQKKRNLIRATYKKLDKFIDADGFNPGNVSNPDTVFNLTADKSFKTIFDEWYAKYKDAIKSQKANRKNTVNVDILKRGKIESFFRGKKKDEAEKEQARKELSDSGAYPDKKPNDSPAEKNEDFVDSRQTLNEFRITNPFATASEYASGMRNKYNTDKILSSIRRSRAGREEDSVGKKGVYGELDQSKDLIGRRSELGKMKDKYENRARDIIAKQQGYGLSYLKRAERNLDNYLVKKKYLRNISDEQYLTSISEDLNRAMSTLYDIGRDLQRLMNEYSNALNKISGELSAQDTKNKEYIGSLNARQAVGNYDAKKADQEKKADDVKDAENIEKAENEEKEELHKAIVAAVQDEIESAKNIDKKAVIYFLEELAKAKSFNDITPEKLLRSLEKDSARKSKDGTSWTSEDNMAAVKAINAMAKFLLDNSIKDFRIGGDSSIKSNTEHSEKLDKIYDAVSSIDANFDNLVDETRKILLSPEELRKYNSQKDAEKNAENLKSQAITRDKIQKKVEEEITDFIKNHKSMTYQDILNRVIHDIDYEKEEYSKADGDYTADERKIASAITSSILRNILKKKQLDKVKKDGLDSLITYEPFENAYKKIAKGKIRDFNKDLKSDLEYDIKSRKIAKEISDEKKRPSEQQIKNVEKGLKDAIAAKDFEGENPETPEEQEQPEDATDKMNILQYATYKAKKLNKK